MADGSSQLQRSPGHEHAPTVDGSSQLQGHSQQQILNAAAEADVGVEAAAASTSSCATLDA
jgi:hypothetical protein